MRMLKTIMIALVLIVSINAQQKLVKKTTNVGRIANISYYCLKGRMANGKNVQSGYVAADTRYYKMGTKLKLNGITYVVGDKGSAIQGPLRFDIYVNSCSLARQLGRKKMFLELY